MATASKPGVTTFTKPSDREITATHVVDAPRSLVFEAWTKAKHVPHWMLGPDGWTMPVVSEPDGKTTIALTVLYPSKAARDAALETGMTGGHVPELRSPRRVPAIDYLRIARQLRARVASATIATTSPAPLRAVNGSRSKTNPRSAETMNPI